MTVARDWLGKNAPNTLGTMQVQEGEVHVASDVTIDCVWGVPTVRPTVPKR